MDVEKNKVAFNSFLYEYGLHDCKINNIKVEKDSISLLFNDGVYYLDSNLHETKKTSPCIMKIGCKGIEKNQEFNYIEVMHRKKNKWTEILFDEFSQKVLMSGIEISINFFSPFCNTILIKGYGLDGEYEITISDTSFVAFRFK